MRNRSCRFATSGLTALVLLAGFAFVGDEGCQGSPSATGPTEIAVPSAVEPGSIATGLASPRAVEQLPFKKLLCFGDSITYGVTQRPLDPLDGSQGSLTIVEGYVPKLWHLLEAKYGAGFELVNAGEPGEGTAEGLARLDLELSAESPEVVLLLEGINDVNSDTPRFSEAIANLEEMVRRVRKAGATVVLGTYPISDPSGFRASNPENVAILNERIRRLASVQGIVLADHEQAFANPAGEGPDGIHPNNLGYEHMAQVWLAALEALAQTFGQT